MRRFLSMGAVCFGFIITLGAGNPDQSTTYYVLQALVGLFLIGVGVVLAKGFVACADNQHR